MVPWFDGDARTEPAFAELWDVCQKGQADKINVAVS
tara:strand:- start:1239 stop:1346 length:108 start_codon:yes stop_codon:yes gene_type:complete